MRGVLRSTVVLGTVLLLAGVPDPATAQECSEHFETTFDLIQSRIFDRRGCTSANCHSGPAPAGGLDLSPNVAYDNLLDAIPQSVPAERYPDLRRVVPGSKGASLLWLNLASATLPEQWKAPLRPMPSGGLPPITFEELAVVATWIEHGAPRNGVVPGSGELVDACLPPPKPLEVTPLPPPPPGVGVQLRAPRQVLPAYSEREVCFVSYYDVTAQVPEEFRGPGGATFRYKRSAVRMDPLSHHSVVVVYPGRTPIDSPLWGRFRCTGGSQEGAACQPTDPDACGGEGTCASEPVPSIACIGFGPGDASILSGAANLINTVGGLRRG